MFGGLKIVSLKGAGFVVGSCLLSCAVEDEGGWRRIGEGVWLLIKFWLTCCLL
jgi:hypothetical protein